ncbi:hypothetical protein F5883DRAFT_721085, partial [Diaporthe sp. PMI_573]
MHLMELGNKGLADRRDSNVETRLPESQAHHILKHTTADSHPKQRIGAVPDEDGIAVIDRSGVTASELSIDLTDPFSASIFSIPARGSACTHMECFDLETWLNTRPIKQVINNGPQYVCTTPKRLEPSEPDKWECHICFGDARPKSLRIDSFLVSQVKRGRRE